ncbi:MAG: DUF5317 domain-containing protein [Anaerolineae bacterium]|nr:DUF5317 domain-containing protein [Anaerolineae bacterium]
MPERHLRLAAADEPMILLLLAVAAGLLAGLGRAWWGGRRLQFPALRLEWLVLVAVIPQVSAFYLPVVRDIFSDWVVAIGLVTSQLCLLTFVWLNRRQPAFWLMGLGLFLNFLVITLNGGFMPISPEMASRLVPTVLPEAWAIGSRFGTSKDIILPIHETQLWVLSDRFFWSTPFTSYRVAFSLGDVGIALGVFLWLWALGRSNLTHLQEINLEKLKTIPE